MQDLDKFKNEMNLSGQNVYVGHRYVPKIMGEWDNTKTYESLSIVQYQGNSFTSRQVVPIGVDINNEDYWASTGNYNAQVENYRQEVKKVGERFTGLETDLTDLETSVNQRGFNILDLGLKGDGTEDITPYLKQALDNHQHVYVPRNTVFKFSDTLEIPEGKTIDFNKSLLKFDNPESSIGVSPNDVITGLRIEVADVKLNRAVLYFDGNKKFPFGHNRRTYLKDIYAEQTTSTTAVNTYENTFIHFDATQKADTECYISGVTIENINSMRFKYGIRNTVITFPNSVTPTYITGTNIDGYIAYNPRYFIYDDDVVNGGEIGGNIYNRVQCQPADNQEKIFLRLVGNNNSLNDVTFWDVSRPSNQTDQIIILGNGNYLQGNIPSIPTPHIKNVGKYNTIIGTFPSAPAMYTNRVIAENAIYKIHENQLRPVKFNIKQSEAKITANNVAGSGGTVLYEKVITPDMLVSNYTSLDMLAYGTNTTPTNKYFGLYIDGVYLFGGTATQSNKETFKVDVNVSIRKYEDRISIKAMLSESGSGTTYVGTKTLTSLTDDFKLSVHFSGSNDGDMVAEYVEANMRVGGSN